jgi:AraC-like DNA-binding protein
MQCDLITQIKQSMRGSCGRADSIEHLCEKVDMPYHILRKTFRRVEGISLVEYWQRCRLQKAEELLSNPSEYIFEVASQRGFSSDGYFTDWFKKHEGMTPKESRRQLQRRRE